MCERVQREAEAKAAGIIVDMGTFEEIPFNRQRLFYYDNGYWGPEFQSHSVWGHSRIIEPRERVVISKAIPATLELLQTESSWSVPHSPRRRRPTNSRNYRAGRPLLRLGRCCATRSCVREKYSVPRRKLLASSGPHAERTQSCSGPE